MYVSVCLSAVCKHEHPHLKHICIRKFTYVSIPSPSQPLLKNMSEQVYKLPHSFKEIRDGEGADLISPNPFFACCNVPKHWCACYYHVCVRCHPIRGRCDFCMYHLFRNGSNLGHCHPGLLEPSVKTVTLPSAISTLETARGLLVAPGMDCPLTGEACGQVKDKSVARVKFERADCTFCSSSSISQPPIVLILSLPYVFFSSLWEPAKMRMKMEILFVATQ